MFLPAFFGLGMQEILVLCILVSGLAGVVVLVKFLSSRGGGRAEALEEENRRLRDDNDRLRGER